jgi:hypothetical protein
MQAQRTATDRSSPRRTPSRRIGSMTEPIWKRHRGDRHYLVSGARAYFGGMPPPEEANQRASPFGCGGRRAFRRKASSEPREPSSRTEASSPPIPPVFGPLVTDTLGSLPTQAAAARSTKAMKRSPEVIEFLAHGSFGLLGGESPGKYRRRRSQAVRCRSRFRNRPARSMTSFRRPRYSAPSRWLQRRTNYPPSPRGFSTRYFPRRSSPVFGNSIDFGTPAAKFSSQLLATRPRPCTTGRRLG